MQRSSHKYTRRRGSALVLVIVLGLILIMLAMGAMLLSNYQTRDRARYETYKDEFAAAEVALNSGFSHIQFLLNYGTPNFDQQIANMQAPVVDGYQFSQFDVTNTFDGNETVPAGENWAGLNLYTRRYRIDVRAESQSNTASRFTHPGVQISQNLEIRYIPLYLFAIFYDPIMEIAPGPYMQVNGLVHCNGDAYIQSQNGLDFMKRVTVAGNMRHGRHTESGKSDDFGTVNFMDLDNNVQRDMTVDGDWLDHDTSNWASKASSRWNGGMEDSAHGISPLSLPIPSVNDPRSIIERADPNDPISLQQEKFENKASLKILRDENGNIVGQDQDGNTVSLTYTDPNDPNNVKSIYTEKTFFDAREDKWVTSLDIDLGNMVESQNSDNPVIPPNGILYVSNELGGSSGVVRLTNGAELPQSPIVEGFTVATADPLYIQGDYNTTNKTLSMVAADALYLLSNAWRDENSNSYSNRIASETTVNAVCMHGIVPSADGTYSGGVENNFRFLEQWSGRNLNFSGSIIIMWESQKALGQWLYGSPVYTAPRRLWSWDTALGGLNGPPGAPRVVELTRTAWAMN